MTQEQIDLMDKSWQHIGICQKLQAEIMKKLYRQFNTLAKECDHKYPDGLSAFTEPSKILGSMACRICQKFCFEDE